MGSGIRATGAKILALSSVLVLLIVQIAAAAPQPPASYAVYENGLASNWVNWSWGAAVKMDAVEDNHKVLAFTPTSGWAGLYLHSNNSFGTTNYKYISFLLKSPSKSSDLSAFVFDSNNQKRNTIAIDSYATDGPVDGWQRFNLPLSALSAENIQISGFVLQASSIIQPTSFIRDTTFSSQPVTVTAATPEPAYSPPTNVTAAPLANDTNSKEMEATKLETNYGMVFNDTQASAGKGLLIWSNDKAGFTIIGTTSLRLISVTAKADLCGSASAMDVLVDGKQIGSAGVDTDYWQTYNFPVDLPAGSHSIQISFTNDMYTSCDRNLRLDKTILAFASAPVPQPTLVPTEPNGALPLIKPAVAVNQQLYVDPNSPAARQAAAWRGSRPADASLMDRMAGQSTAKWFGNWSGNIQNSVDAYLTAANGSTPVLVIYNIPNRDCGNYSANSMSATGYRAWVDQFATGIKNRPAIIILEPDALALDSCLNNDLKAERHELLASAVTKLSAVGAKVYLDAGHAEWIAPTDMAKRLSAAGVAKAAGFSLNVSNFGTTDKQISYGTVLSKSLNNTHFVIDTSRSGNGSNGEWCNPSGRAVGQLPTLTSNNVLVDAYLWIKTPGESDGQCNGGPSAGQWWPEYALGLLR